VIEIFAATSNRFIATVLCMGGVALGSLPDKIGGNRVAFWSLVTEAIGQIMVWGALNEIVALAGAFVTGLGCALVFPVLGLRP
jgi:MFS family permease